METETELPSTTVSSSFDDEEVSANRFDLVRFSLELFTAVGILSVIADLLLAFVILRYKKLRREPTNQLILHISILQALYLFFTPLTLRIIFEFSDYFNREHYVGFCVIQDIEHSLQLGIMLTLNLIIADWYVKVYKDHLYAKFSRIYKFLLVSIYVIVVCVLIIVTRHSCFAGSWWFFPFLIIIDILVCGLLLIIIIVMNIIHRIKNRRLTNIGNVNNTGLAIANIFVLFWLPAALIFLIANIVPFASPSRSPAIAIAMVTLTCIGFGSSLGNFAYLYFYDNSFNLILKNVFKCRCFKYENELGDDEDDDNTVAYNNSNGVQIYDTNLSTAERNLKNSENGNQLLIV